MSILDDVSGAFADLGSLAANGTLALTTRGAFDTVTGSPTPGSTTTCNVKVVLESTSLRTLGFKFGEALVQTGDLEAMVPAKDLTFTPQAGCVLTVGGLSYTVIQARPTYEGAVPVLWGLLVRR